VLATSFTLPIVTYPLTGPPGSPAETITLFDLRIAWAVAVFLFISAIAYLAIASPRALPTYERMLGGSLMPFCLGCVVGVFPWLSIGSYLVGVGTDVQAPGFVYAIFISLFVFFMSFAVVQWLQYRQVGPWKDYLVGETSYVVLSLVAKSALAWQIFAGALAGA
jgi:hypothetical protein